MLIPFALTALTSQLLFTWSFRHHKRKELKGKWKLAGHFVSVEDAAAICVQAHFRKHSAMIDKYRKDVSAILLQSAFRGAMHRAKLGKGNSFGTIAMAVHTDIHLQRGLHEARKVDQAEEQLAEMRKTFAEESVAPTPR